jgi:hypothetical protein
MEPWPAESTKRSRSGHVGLAASNFRKRENRTVAMSAVPIGIPGWPDFAFSTASMASERIAFASLSCCARLMTSVGIENSSLRRADFSRDERPSDGKGPGQDESGAARGVS